MRVNSILHKPIRLLGAGSLLFALLLAGQPAFAALSGSKHDLTSTGTGTTKTSSTAEICVFCHTPHGASATAPLWNRGASGASYTMYSSATTDSTLLSLGSNSAACMSCHDGVTALDLLINKPGSGGYTSGGVSAGYTWTNGSTLSAAGITNLTGDLSNDHPIGVAYCSGFTSAGVCKDGDFKLGALAKKVGAATALTGTAAAVMSNNLTDQFWIDTSGTGTREKTDIILYARTFTDPSGVFPSVECASCHEPHNGGAASTPFLRIANTSSALCTTCHNK